MQTFNIFGYILGLTSTALMLLLAVNSNKRSMKFLCSSWKRVLQFAYLAGILVILHMVLLKQGVWASYAVLLILGFLICSIIIKGAITKIRHPHDPSADLMKINQLRNSYL